MFLNKKYKYLIDIVKQCLTKQITKKMQIRAMVAYHLSEWLLLKKQEASEEGYRGKNCSYIVGRKVNWCSLCE